MPIEMGTKEGHMVSVLRVIVFYPDSGISNRDEIFITGFGFRIDDVSIEG